MLTIRLQRVGRKHEPTFRVVVTDSRTAAKKNRRLHEIVGAYDAREKNETRLDGERIKHWIAQGAQPTGTVHNLLVTKKVIEGKKQNVLPSKNPIRPKKEGEEEKAVAPAAAAVEAPKVEEKKEEAPVAAAPAEEPAAEVVAEAAPEAAPEVVAEPAPEVAADEPKPESETPAA